MLKLSDQKWKCLLMFPNKHLKKNHLQSSIQETNHGIISSFLTKQQKYIESEKIQRPRKEKRKKFVFLKEF